MAGPLTWREVAAPSFSGVSSALSTFGTLLNNAAQSGQQAIAGWQANQQDQAGAAAMLNEMARRDPVGTEAMLAGVDRNNLNVGTLSKIQAQRNDGLKQTQLAQAIQKGAYDMARTTKADTAMDGAQPYIQALQQAANTGDFDTYRKVQSAAQAAGAFNGIPIDKLQSMLSGTQANLAGSQQAQGRSQEVADKQAVAKSMVEAATNDFDSTDTVERILNDKTMTPIQKQMALKASGLDAWGQPIAAAGSGTSSSGSGGAKGKVAAAPAGTAARTDQIFNSLLNTESGGSHTNPDGSVKTSSKGAIGIAQVMPDTAPEAAKMAGLPWDEAKYRNDPEYNKALGKAYFTNMLNRFGGNEEKALAAYNAGPGAVERAVVATANSKDPMAWLKALPKETQDYVPKTLSRAGTDVGVVPGESTTARTNAQAIVDASAAGRRITSREAQLASKGIPNLAEIEADNSSRMSLAQQMTGKDGAFSGYDANDLAPIIREVEQKFGLKASVAAKAVEIAAKGDTRWIKWGKVKLDDIVDEKELVTIANLVGTGKQHTIDDYREVVKDAGKTVISAAAALKEAETAEAAAKLRAKGRGPGAQAGVTRATAAVTKAREALDLSLRNAERSDGLQLSTTNPTNLRETPREGGIARGGEVLEQQPSSAGSRAQQDLQRAEAALSRAEPGTQAYAKAEREVQKARRLARLLN